MNLPASFIDYTRALLGNEEYEKLAVALQQEPPVSIRLNEKLGALSQNAGEPILHSSFIILHSSFFIQIKLGRFGNGEILFQVLSDFMSSQSLFGDTTIL